MNPLNVCLGVTAALIYALLGYSAQDKPFNWKSFCEQLPSALFQL
jgi:hypothetical protein